MSEWNVFMDLGAPRLGAALGLLGVERPEAAHDLDVGGARGRREGRRRRAARPVPAVACFREEIAEKSNKLTTR